MEIKCFLAITSSGSVRVTKNRPALDYNEIAVQLNLSIPNAIFKKPAIEATITIPEEVVSNEIPTEVIDDLKSIIQSQGFKVNLIISSDEADKQS